MTNRILTNRGIASPEEARRFLHPALSDLPDPFAMKDMEKAVRRIIQALRRGETIHLFGDYDVDGTTAAAVLSLFLKAAGGKVDFTLPHRLKEGYGLNLEALKRIHASGCRLLITADCGISNREEIRWSQEQGMDVIVTDHHEIPELLPPALALLNPKQPDCGYPFKGLAGVGVAFNLAIALRSRLREESFFPRGNGPNLKEYLDLVALGTVSDVVPLTGVNRILVKYGLAELARAHRPGIAALKEVSGMESGPVDSAGINFRLAPRINAAGRLEDAREVVHLLVTEDPREAKRIALHLNELNSLRQRMEEKTLAEAKEMIDPGKKRRSIVLASQGWHPGIIGIVASRLTEQFRCPTILIALQEDRGKGSGRSIAAFSLFEGLKACREWMEGFGGHEQAAGLVIRPDRIPDFARAFEEVVAARVSEEEAIPRLTIDAIARLEQLNASFLSELEALAPFGVGNPEPVLGLEGLDVLGSRPVGRGHLRIRIREGRQTREAIGFGMGPRHPLAGEGMKMAFSPQVNRYQGSRNLQIKVLDLQREES
ncbi:MAG: single-stranded-DNA-specific exonuclease RecJ [Syntrophaceae bacterium]|nr:single-stranded-DNA-specific exonuclease RecJ [Syntrophaceae bacterium]